MCVVWGATFVLEQAALRHVATLVFIVLRFAVAAVALLAVGGNPLKARAAGVLTGIFLYVGCFTQAEGLRFTTPSKSAFITGLCVIIVPLAACAVERVRPHWGVIAGAVIALLGLALLTGAAHQNTFGASMNRGDLWTLACAFFFAVHILLMGHYSPRVRPRDLAAGQAVTAAILALLTFAASPMPLSNAPVVWWAVAITGLVGTAAAFLIQAWAQQFTTSSHTALIFSSEPVFAWITSGIVLHERLGVSATSGALLILGGILLAELLGRRTAIEV